MKKPPVVHLAIASAMLLLCAPESVAQEEAAKEKSDNIEVL